VLKTSDKLKLLHILADLETVSHSLRGDYPFAYEEIKTKVFDPLLRDVVTHGYDLQFPLFPVSGGSVLWENHGLKVKYSIGEYKKTKIIMIEDRAPDFVTEGN